MVPVLYHSWSSQEKETRQEFEQREAGAAGACRGGAHQIQEGGPLLTKLNIVPVSKVKIYKGPGSIFRVGSER